MRYLITTHGCFRKHETIDLNDVKLLMYAHENECIRYSKRYYQTFCNKSVQKRKGNYKRKFIATKKYYQMEFGSLPEDEFESYIQCCRTKKIIYNFKNGDMLLSDILDMITAYNNHFNPTPIYVSVLTCNTNCADKSETNENDYGENLGLGRPPFLFPSSKKNWNSTRNAGANARKRNMLIPSSRGTLRHRFKPGNRVIEPNGTETLVTEKNRKSLKAMGSYLLPPAKPGNSVYYQNKLWRIQSIQGERYTLIPLLDKLEPFKGFSKSKSKTFSGMLSAYKSRSASAEVEVFMPNVEGITVNARDTRKMEI